jgi:DNA-binding MarR family transcriptional regulator
MTKQASVASLTSSASSAVDQRLECAAQILKTVPMMLGAIRRRIRQDNPAARVSMPQFGILIFLRRNEGATLSDLADHLGLLRPTMSKMVHAMVERGLVTRQAHPRDRRRVRLGLTEAGKQCFDAHESRMRLSLAEMIKPFSAEERQTVTRAMLIVQAASTE